MGTTTWHLLSVTSQPVWKTSTATNELPVQVKRTPKMEIAKPQKMRLSWRIIKAIAQTTTENSDDFIVRTIGETSNNMLKAKQQRSRRKTENMQKARWIIDEINVNKIMTKEELKKPNRKLEGKLDISNCNEEILCKIVEDNKGLKVFRRKLHREKQKLGT